MTPRLHVLILLLVGMLVFPVLAASESPDAAAMFGKRCSGCHTYGKGIRVGPDLKGATDRHPRNWLLQFIKSSQSLIEAGDPAAIALFGQFNHQRMPDHDLSPQQIEGLLDYLASGGPESAGQAERDADTATPAEIDMGRRLFYGEAHLAHAGPACSSCHSVEDAGWGRGGSLGPNLNTAYIQYQDKALTSFLKSPCFPRAFHLSEAAFLTPEESFALKAYLWQVSLRQRQLTMQVGTLDVQGSGIRTESREIVQPHDRRESFRINFLFVVCPYAGFAVLVVGLLIRSVLAGKCIAASEAAWSEAWELFCSGKAGCLSLLVFFLVHFVGVLFPNKIILWDSVPLQLYVLEGLTFAAGVLGLAIYISLMWRYLGRSGRPMLEEAADVVFFALLFVGLLSGLLSAALYRWSSSWAVVTLTPYMLSLFRGRPAVQFVAEMPFLVQLHVFSAFVGLAVLPFTRTASLLILPLYRGLDLFVKPFFVRARLCRRVVDGWLQRYNPGVWIFRDEEE